MVTEPLAGVQPIVMKVKPASVTKDFIGIGKHSKLSTKSTEIVPYDPKLGSIVSFFQINT